MELRSRMYPYPVLSPITNSYLDSKFDIVISPEITKEKIVLKFTVELSDEGLRNLIDKEQATFAVHVECPSTRYRNMYKFSTNYLEIEINSGKVNNAIHCCPFILANKEILGYTNPNFNEIYRGLSFDIEKHNVLASSTTNVVTVSKDYDEIKNVRSIFSIIQDFSGDNVIKANYENDKIVIKIPKDQFEDYRIAKSVPFNTSTIHAILIIPVLLQIFENIKNGKIEEYESYRWFRALETAFKRKGIPFDENSFKNFDTLKNAQLIIDSPIISSLKNMNIIIDREVA